MDDASLVEAARSGDGTAWAAIYDRYADRLHDHCHRLLRDRDEAADALHDAFIAASRNLHQLRDPSRLRPWLYSICRNESLRRARRRSRVELTDEVDQMTSVDVDLDRGTRVEELQELMWSAAAGLNERDQALLDLNLRQGLDGQDLADAMGVSLSASYVLMSRLRDQVERSLGALLIARLGREDCDDLARILEGWDGRFTPLLRKRVARHVDGCETCTSRRSAVLSPAALLAAAPLAPAPSDLRDRILTGIGSDRPGPDIAFTADGFAAPTPGPGRRRAWWWAAVAAVLLLLLAGGAIAAGDRDAVDGDLVAVEASTTTTAATPTSSTTTSTTTTEPEAVPPAPPDPSIAPPSSPPPTPPPDTTAPTVGALVPSASTIQTGCNPDNDSATISTTVADDTGVAAVVLSWSGEPGSGSTQMTASGSAYSAVLPADEPFGTPGTVTYTVTAADDAGNSASRSGSLTVDPCPG